MCFLNKWGISQDLNWPTFVCFVLIHLIQVIWFVINVRKTLWLFFTLSGVVLLHCIKTSMDSVMRRESNHLQMSQLRPVKCG